MNARPVLFFVASILLLVMLTACDLPAIEYPIIEPTEEPSPTSPPPSPTPYCPEAASYGRISEHLPSSYHLVSTSPTFTWFYSTGGANMLEVDDWDQACVPETYTLYLSTGPEYDDEIPIEVTDPTVARDITKLTMEWTMSGALQPLSEYRWFMVGHARGFAIDDYWIFKLHDDTFWPPWSRYFTSVFRTGPECTPGNIAVPRLEYPAEGDVIQTLTPTLRWDVEGCMPLVFMVYISTTPTFENLQYYVDPAVPGDYSVRRQTNYAYLNVDYMLRDCTDYYWRVTGGIGEGGAGGYREWGSSSDTRSFRVRIGQCATPTPTSTPTPTASNTPLPLPPTNTPKPPKTPTPKPSVCTGLNQDTCQSTPGCEWYDPGVAAPYCRAIP